MRDIKDKEITLTLNQTDLQLIDILLDSGMRAGKTALMAGEKTPALDESGKPLYMAKACVMLESKISKQVIEQTTIIENAKV